MKANQNLVWRHYKALNELYTKGRTLAKITTNPYINAILMKQKKLIKPKVGNIKILEAQPAFKAFYEKEFKTSYERFEKFLNDQRLNDDARQKYSAQDLLTLMFIEENKSTLKAGLTTIRKFSNIIFKGHGSKYLEQHPGLHLAVCKLLEITEFPEKDPKTLQWRLVVDCTNPRGIVLCENLDFLKVPWTARENQIELWYVGGNNTAIIDFISEDKLKLPIYYSCDWDRHGIRIYLMIKEKLKSKGCDIILLFPENSDLRLPVVMPNHKSKWLRDKPFSGFKREFFTVKERKLIEELIQDDQWIEEESFELIGLLTYNEVLP